MGPLVVRILEVPLACRPTPGEAIKYPTLRRSIRAALEHANRAGCPPNPRNLAFGTAR